MQELESDSEDELPPGWEERATLQGEVFYVNHSETSTQWTHPRTGRKKKVSDNLPFGWERKILEDNKVVYVDHHNKRTTFTDPRLAFATETNASKAGFRQRFDGSTGALQVLHGLDLTDKVAVVTGANSGIGFETARALAFHGCKVVFACRSDAKANAAIDRIRQERPAAKCTSLHLDLASFSSVKQFAQRLAILHSAIDFLVLNAGVFGKPYEITEDGLESMLQVNYLSNYYLLTLLLKSLTASLSSRVVLLSAESHRFAPDENLRDVVFDPNPAQFISIEQYNRSKLYLTLLAVAVHNQYSHLGIRCVAVHPGNLVYTNLKRSWWLYWMLFSLVRPFTKSANQAAASVLFGLVSPDLDSVKGFTYINNCFPTRPSEAVENMENAQQLWQNTAAFFKYRNL